MKTKLSELKNELEVQLKSDILSYSWLVMETARLFPDLDFCERMKLLVQALDDLEKKESLLIGPAKSVQSVLQIEPLSETFDNSLEKLREFIDVNGDPTGNQELGFSVWVGLNIDD